MIRPLASGLLAALAFCQPIAISASLLELSVELPRLDVTEYRRPYLAVWIERADQSVAANLALWYESAQGDKGTKWLPDLRQWWRRSGRDQQFPIDGVTGATRPAGQYQLRFAGTDAPLKGLPAGRYTLVVEAAREVGGREVIRLPFDWPAQAATRLSAQGKTELGAIDLAVNP